MFSHICLILKDNYWNNKKCFLVVNVWCMDYTMILQDKFNTLKYCIVRYIKVSPVLITAQKMKFSIKDFFSKRDQIRRFLPIWSHLLKSLMKIFIFCAVIEPWVTDQSLLNTNRTWKSFCYVRFIKVPV